MIKIKCAHDPAISSGEIGLRCISKMAARRPYLKSDQAESAENAVSRELVKLCVTVIEQYTGTDALLIITDVAVGWLTIFIIQSTF
jgi:hypothetical protein